ncbi:MAG: relaxase domain-containing protein [Ignavibacteriae bacterium]|nr:relaxase domain-containing protein [Ignavibacteriota bacterium]MCB9217154.1 relaxase domain-containing protein [Ignavibacteria bacterium]
MIRMIQSRSAGQAKAYFSDALSKSDYYVNQQELSGFWGGRLSARLGLSGETRKDDFFALCENQRPGTGENLTPRTRANRTVGYDINFHAPKSLSILHAVSGDDHILDLFRESVRATMTEIEADSKTRIRRDGVYDDRATGELLYAHFVHQTARPVDGSLPDPHLHSHCFVMNATYDPVEEKIKAGQFRDIKRDMPYYQAKFHKRLADNMTDHGYQTRKTATSFEAMGVPQRVIDLFSKRTDEIGRIANERGITDAKEKSALGARTRAKKQKGATMEELKAAWVAQIRALPADKGEDGKQTVRFAPTPETSTLTAQECVNYAIDHCFERASVMDGKRILAVAYTRALEHPEVSVEEIDAAFAVDQRIVNVMEGGRAMCTTRDVLAEEKQMVDRARAGQGTVRPLYETAPENSLLGQQGEAVTHILTTQDRVSIIRGKAGTGKTTLMKEAVRLIEEAGKNVMAVAPTARASRGVLKEEGFEKATTVAHLLADVSLQAQLKDQVLWVDEAGLLGTKDMTALLDLTARMNARLVLAGDTRQHASVIRGDALRILNTVAGIPVAEVSKIYRQQREQFRSAVEDLGEGQVDKAFAKLDAMGSIRDMQDSTSSLVDDYMDVLLRGKSALVISPTHSQGDEITGQIREKLRDNGKLGIKEIAVTRLQNRNLTEAEKSDPRNFSPGEIVQFTQNAPGFLRGSQWKVAGVTKEGVHARNDNGVTRSLPLDKSDRFDVLTEGVIPLSKGDTIRITRNGFDADKKPLNNGDILTVVSVYKSGRIKLQNAQSRNTYTISADFGHLAHAHCITSYAAQGRTVDEVFVYQPAATFPATDAKQFYVSVSRARDAVHIYTDDKEDLLHHAAELRDRQSALELIGRNRHAELVHHLNHTTPTITPPQPPKGRNGHEPEI